MRSYDCLYRYRWVVLLTLFFLLTACANSSVHEETELREPTKVFIEVAGEQRRYLLLLPSEQPEVGLPVVFDDLHGAGSTPESQHETSEFARVALQQNFIVVYPATPDGEPRWSAGVANFFAAMLDQLIEQYQIDEKRVYVTGFSNGGFAAHYLATVHADRITAVASVGGLLPDFAKSGEPARPVPVLMFHGVNDTVVPYSGVQETIDIWKERNNCSPDPAPSLLKDEVTVDRYSGCDHDVRVELYSFDFGERAHIYPRGREQVEVSAVIWAFFSDFELE